MKSKYFKWLLFLFSLHPGFIFAHTSSRELCESLLSQNKPTIKHYFHGIKSYYLPGLYTQPKITTIKAKNIMHSQEDLKDLRSIIFSLGPTQEKLNYFKNDEDNYKKLRQSLLEGNKKIERLKEVIKKKCTRKSLNRSSKRLKCTRYENREERISRCEKSQKSIGFDYELYQQTVMNFSAFSVPKEKFIAHIVQKNFSEVEEKLNLDWEYFPVSTLSEVHQYLNAGDVENIIIVSHGSQSGHIYDSNNNEFPAHFFKLISSSVRSITLFSCYSQKSSENVYMLPKILSNSTSMHEERILISVKNNQIKGHESLILVTGFSAFLKKVDTYLSEQILSPINLNLATNSPKKKCSLVIKGIASIRDKIAVSINKHFIGTISPNSSTLLNYPCSIHQAENNLLYLSPTNKNIREYNSNSKVLFEIETPEFPLLTGEVRLHFTQNKGRELLLRGKAYF